MADELYSDGIGEITVTGTIVRIDLVSLSPTERDLKGNPKPVFRQRIIMPIDAFANSVDVMDKALAGLVDAGAVRRAPEVTPLPGAATAPVEQPRTKKATPPENSSPNFN
ncbi:MAG: hypothetical protein QM744_06910 [Mesorhizobium sp.]